MRAKKCDFWLAGMHLSEEMRGRRRGLRMPKKSLLWSVLVVHAVAVVAVVLVAVVVLANVVSLAEI